MSKDTKAKGKVPETKVEKPKVIKCTKSQKDLFVTKRNKYNEGLKVIVEKYNDVTSEGLGKMVDVFIEELKIDVVSDDWEFDAKSLQFTRVEKK